MKNRVKIIFIICISFLFYKCYYDKASQVYPQQGSCDTTNIRLSVELNAIMNASCMSCHAGNANNGGGIKLQDYTTISKIANNGTLLSSISWDGKVAQMPQGGAKLSDCDINKFKAWINAGAPNN